VIYPAIGLAVTALIVLIAAGAVIRLSLKGKLALGNWDIPIAILFFILSGALGATAVAVWRFS